MNIFGHFPDWTLGIYWTSGACPCEAEGQQGSIQGQSALGDGALEITCSYAGNYEWYLYVAAMNITWGVQNNKSLHALKIIVEMRLYCV